MKRDENKTLCCEDESHENEALHLIMMKLYKQKNLLPKKNYKKIIFPFSLLPRHSVHILLPEMEIKRKLRVIF